MLRRYVKMVETERVVNSTGISLTVNGVRKTYWEPELLNYHRRKVKIRFEQKNLEQIHGYNLDTGEFVVEAPALSYEVVEVIRR
jgi:Mu transposase, C-terminal